MKRYVLFILFLTIAHIITYLVVGALAYEFITKQFYQGEVPTFIFMRTESEPQLWAHAMRWMIPGQLIRGVIMGLALLPLMAVLVRASILKRGLIISLIYFVFSHLSQQAQRQAILKDSYISDQSISPQGPSCLPSQKK